MTESVTEKLMLSFPRCECEKPILYHLVKDYNLIVNVFRASVTPDEAGYLVLDVTGTAGDIAGAMAYIQALDVCVCETSKGLNWSEDGRDNRVRWLPMDVNGDGKTDLVHVRSDNGGTLVYTRPFLAN